MISYNNWGCVAVFVLDFVRHVLACYVQSPGTGASVWTFQVLFLPATSNLTTLARRFGLLKSCSYPQRPIFQLRRVILDLSSPIPARNVQSARSDSTVWTFQVHFLPETSNPSATSKQSTTTYIRN